MTHTNSLKKHQIRKLTITQLSSIYNCHVVSDYTFKI